jgi:hypothetical protein
LKSLIISRISATGFDSATTMRVLPSRAGQLAF